jgi:hypothetical protein
MYLTYLRLLTYIIQLWLNHKYLFFINVLETRPGFTWVQCWYSSVSLLYYPCYIHINLPLESLYLLKTASKSNSLKYVSIHRDSQREATLFYTMLLWLWCIIGFVVNCWIWVLSFDISLYFSIYIMHGQQHVTLYTCSSILTLIPLK